MCGGMNGMGSTGVVGNLTMSEQMIPGRSPGALKGTLARPGAPKSKKKETYKPKLGGSVKPAIGK